MIMIDSGLVELSVSGAVLIDDHDVWSQPSSSADSRSLLIFRS